jgi:hypothetical protein
MQVKRALLFILSIILLSVALVVPVFADGSTAKETCVTQYGGATECHTETINEEVTHETVNAGVSEDLAVIAGIALAGGALLFILSKVTRRAYLLD